MAMTLTLAEWGGGYDGGTPPASDGFTLSGSLSRVTSKASLVLRHNGGANLPVNANGALAGASRRAEPLRGDCERRAEWPDPHHGHRPSLPFLPPGFASDLLLSAEHVTLIGLHSQGNCACCGRPGTASSAQRAPDARQGDRSSG